MRVLLIAMPDTVSALDAVIRVPNLGLCSIAGNVQDCEVRVLDLAFHNKGIGRFLVRVLEDFRPELIGLSAMSFQYASACRAAGICREAVPGARIVLGGYHATLMHEEIGAGPDAGLFDFLVRGEGELTFSSLAQRLVSRRSDYGGIAGLSFREGGTFTHNPPAPLLGLDEIRLPDRDCRILDKAGFMGRSFDCVETSRGCTMGCHFCSIGHMYGRCIREFGLERVMADLEGLKKRGKQGAFFVDDNITLNVPRLRRLCQVIVERGLDDISYVMQASVAGIASDPGLAGWLSRAGFKWVFLGIESGIPRDLESMGKKGSVDDARRAVRSLKAEGIGVFGGLIIGHPEDNAADIRSAFEFALDIGVDHPIVQCLTPYPKTTTRAVLLERGLITNVDDYALYNGFTANIRTEFLSTKQLNDAVFLNGVRLYFNPRYIVRSRFWRCRPTLWPALVANNFRYVAGAKRGKIFASNHRW